MNTADIENYTRDFWRGETPKPGKILELVGVEEIMKLSGFTKNSVHTFAARNDFPSPAAHVGRKQFWRKKDIERWLKTKA